MNPEGLEHALDRLRVAYGQLSIPDWQDHASAVPDAIAGLSDFYLHVDAVTGVVDPAPLYLDKSRVVLGLIPAVVAPLVRLLQDQTTHIDLALANGWSLPPTEEPAWQHWHDRLGRYVTSLERELAAPHTPSEMLWREVTAPLLQGIYPEGFDALGIANPRVASKPDASTVPTTAFMVALQTQEVGRVQGWLLRWREGVSSWVHGTREALAALVESAKQGVREGVGSVAKTVTISVLLAGLVFAGVQVVRSDAKPARSKRERELS